MKKNIYLILFMVGVLIIGVPQLRIFLNEMKMAEQLQAYEERVEVYPVQDLHVYTEQLEAVNQPDAPSETTTEGNPPQEDAGSTDITDPFTVDVAPDEYPVTSELFPDGVIGYITIPKIGEQLSLFNGATNYHLSLGAATVSGTSLPVGGESTHAVISAHRGYAGANYFRFIDLLVPGDKILVTVLDKVLTYEVTGSQIVEANDASSLGIEQGKDLLTLLSCHPYMINDKRILIHSKRVETTEIPTVIASAPNTGQANAEARSHTPESSVVLAETEPESEGIQASDTTAATSPTQVVRSLVSVTFKFNHATLTGAVKRNVILNRLIVLLSLVSLGGAMILLVRNIIKKG
ncbi:class C sortase [Jeotgalibaca sp. A127]|uniref:class C sortase n=1 Tax=Jeotgalibaca sp. A127 TaxID=3457324 RepID=UPI003FD4982B